MEKRKRRRLRGIAPAAPAQKEAPGSHADFRASPAPPHGSVTGGVCALVRLEGMAAFAAALVLYAQSGYSLAALALFFPVPDLSMLAYLAGPRLGTIAYNLAHTHAAALTLTLAGFLGGMPAATAAGLIWMAHIGFDRMLGYGLKYLTGFGDTHLGRIGRR